MPNDGRFKITQDCKHPGHYGHIRDRDGGGIAIADLHHGTHARAEEMVGDANVAEELREDLKKLRAEFEAGKCPGTRDCVQYLGMEMKLLKRVADLKSENACADAIEKLWQEMIIARNPGYGEWEYPGQAYRHIKAEYDDVVAKLARVKTEIDCRVQHGADSNGHLEAIAEMIEKA